MRNLHMHVRVHWMLIRTWYFLLHIQWSKRRSWIPVLVFGDLLDANAYWSSYRQMVLLGYCL